LLENNGSYALCATLAGGSTILIALSVTDVTVSIGSPVTVVASTSVHCFSRHPNCLAVCFYDTNPKVSLYTLSGTTITTVSTSTVDVFSGTPTFYSMGFLYTSTDKLVWVYKNYTYAGGFICALLSISGTSITISYVVATSVSSTYSVRDLKEISPNRFYLNLGEPTDPGRDVVLIDTAGSISIFSNFSSLLGIQAVILKTQNDLLYSLSGTTSALLQYINTIDTTTNPPTLINRQYFPAKGNTALVSAYYYNFVFSESMFEEPSNRFVLSGGSCDVFLKSVTENFVTYTLVNNVPSCISGSPYTANLLTLDFAKGYAKNTSYSFSGLSSNCFKLEVAEI